MTGVQTCALPIYFFVSSLPWLSYTQIQHPCVSADDSNPRLSWGKFTEENGKVMLPVSLMFNHALADGWHATQFYRNLERELAELTALFQSENQ